VKIQLFQVQTRSQHPLQSAQMPNTPAIAREYVVAVCGQACRDAAFTVAAEAAAKRMREDAQIGSDTDVDVVSIVRIVEPLVVMTN